MERSGNEEVVLVAPDRAERLYRDFVGALGEVSARPHDLRLTTERFEPGTWTLALEVESLVSFVESCSAPVHLVGHSGGGATALAFATAHPHLLRR
jgi:pimeloyl-ACP methyl ester carboxylesterase